MRMHRWYCFLRRWSRSCFTKVDGSPPTPRYWRVVFEIDGHFILWYIIKFIMSIHVANENNTPPLILSFSSRDRVSGTNSSYVSRALNVPDNNFDSVCLLQASIPRSFYNVSRGRNTFLLEENGIQTEVVIPPASYNIYNIQKVLGDAMTVASTQSWVYTVTYPACDGDTYHFTFTVSGNAGVQPKIIFNILFSMERQLGFDELSTNEFVGDKLESTNAVNMSFITRAFIVSDICQSANNSVLEEVLNYADYGLRSICYYQQQDVDINSRIFAKTNTNSWTFSLVDSFGQQIDLNGIPWAISVVLFQRENLAALQKLEMQIMNELRQFDLQALRENTVTKVSSSSASRSAEPAQTAAPTTEIDLNNIANIEQPTFPLQIIGSSVIKQVDFDFGQI